MSTVTHHDGHGRWRRNSLIAFVLGLLLAGLWVASALQERRDLESRIPVLLDEVTRKQAMAVNREALKDQLDVFKQILAMTERQFPARFDADELQQDLEAFAASQGLALIAIVRGEEVLREYFGELHFEITLQGPSVALYDFLGLLTHTLPIKHVRAMDLRAEQPDAVALTAKLEVVYFRSVDLQEASHDSAR
jgi:Tfp pilus assembly protein PilO